MTYAGSFPIRGWSLKVLLSAYACEPGKGSEPEVGLRAMLAVASRHEVWVLTRSNNISVLTEFLQSHPLRDRIHLVGMEASDRAVSLKRKGLLPVQIYYDLWQRSAGRIARRLDEEVEFDLVHHVTFASFWSRTGVATLNRPLVWGPVGGGVAVPRHFTRLLGWRGVAGEMARAIVRGPAGWAHNPARNRAAPTLVLAQNRETARKLGGFSDVRVLSNATVVSLPATITDGSRTKEVAFVGRLVPWKAGTLAVRVMNHVADPDAVLVVYGQGRDAARIQRLARARGVKVRFEGQLSRDRLLDSVARSSVLLHVALHEEAGLAVAEALSLGTPVVCLDHGGPSELVRRWGSTPSVAVPPSSPEATARQLAVAVEGFLAAPAEIRRSPLAPDPTFRSEILRAYEDLLRSR
ncbi:MAG: glycosyltransferase [Gammaproteobacteria bacterium]|nr:glycosyltransferase [Gammaproteobacteria bacterium]